MCRKYQISRTLLYRWKARYLASGGLSVLSQKRPVEEKELGDDVVSLLIRSLWEEPESSLRKTYHFIASQTWGEKISFYRFSTVVRQFGLTPRKSRYMWARHHGTFEEAWQTLVGRTANQKLLVPPGLRVAMVRRARRGDSVGRLAQELGVSRALVYRWQKRAERAGTFSESSLGMLLAPRLPAKPATYYRQATQEQVAAVLTLARQHPEWGVERLAEYMPFIDGKPVIGRHGVQRVLERQGLNTAAARLAWVRGREPVAGTLPKPLPGAVPATGEAEFLPSHAPAPPPAPTFPSFLGAAPSAPADRSLFRLFPPFFASFLLSFALASWVRMLLLAPSLGEALGWLFGSVALLAGTLFFIYSLKYYLTIAVVLSFSRRSARVEEASRGGFLTRFFQGEGHDRPDEPALAMPSRWTLSGILRAVFGVLPERGESSPVPIGGLDAHLETVTLTRYPVISVQIPLYNEKRVAERIIRAVQAFDYPQFEVLIIDDSTDETTDICRKAAAGDSRIQVLHRPTRAGYKGGALAFAASRQHPKTEFVVVFDADFVPYPDTLTQFVKYFKAVNEGVEDYSTMEVAAVQGYQWHVLNKSENWITKGVRGEFAGSYVIERSGEEVYGGLKQIAGSVYMLRVAALSAVGGWGTSITEDFELTLKLYEAGFKVLYTPYIQAPSECVSTFKRLVRQRMRWAEGHSNNVKRMFWRLLTSRKLTVMEKVEFLYLSPYYLQAAFFLVGTFCWLLSEVVFQTRLPFWTELWGWSLVLTNMFALVLVNAVGLFLEEAEERDYAGLFSFVAMSYLLVPFQAYAAFRGFLEEHEGPWFRTPKTGKITDAFRRGSFYRWIQGILSWGDGGLAASLEQGWRAVGWLPQPAYGFKDGVSRQSGSSPLARSAQDDSGGIASLPPLSAVGETLATVPAYDASGRLTAFNRFRSFRIRRRQRRWVGNAVLAGLVSVAILLTGLAPLVEADSSVYAGEPTLATVEGRQTREDTVSFNKGVVADEDVVVRNALSDEIDTPRAVRRETKNGDVAEFIFHKEPRVRLKLGRNEIELTTTKVGGRLVSPEKALIYLDNEVVYSEIVPHVDLKYTVAGDLLVEEFILKDRWAAERFDGVVEQEVKTVGVQVVSPDPGSFGIYDRDGLEVFRFGAPFLKDGEERVSTDVMVSMEDMGKAQRLVKRIGVAGKAWLAAPERAFPVVLDPSVVVSGGIADGDVQFGGLQRKVVYVNSNWYAFYNDAGDISYKKSSDGVSWGSAVSVDDADTDNYNPSLDVSGDMIQVFWVDDGAEVIEGRRINTASSDAQGTLCQSASQGTIGSSFMPTVAAVSATEGVVAYSDTSTDGEVDVFDITGLDGTCTVTDVSPGNVTFGAGITASDRPVVVHVTGSKVAMVFQDGDLSYSELDVSVDEWTTNNLQIANVTDTVYSVVTDGTTVWVLSVSSTTAATLYSCCSADFAETQLDSDAGSNGQDNASDIAMFCVAADDCKIVYTDDIDTTAPTLTFIDCDNESCSTNQATVIDSDIGAANDVANPAIYCVATDNCKIVYHDNVETTGPDVKFVDCTSANQECTTQSIVTIGADVGSAGHKGVAAIYCLSDTDCQWVGWDDGGDFLRYLDCSAADCATQDATKVLTNEVNTAGNARMSVGIDCPSAGNCKVVYYDSVDGDLFFHDCSDDGAAGQCDGGTTTTIDADVGTGVDVAVAIDCVGTDNDCKFIYDDSSQDELVFVDCGDATCTDANDTKTTIDATTNAAGASVDMDCVSVTDCKIIYVGDVTSGSERMYFVDCDAAACDTGSVTIMPGPRFRGGLQCLTTGNCKFAYYEGTTSTAPAVQFADCDVTNCFPSSSDLTDPWTGQTAVESVSLTYDSTNSDLFAHIIKDTSDQAYFKSSDASTISWSDEYSYAFTAGDLNDISAPETSAGTTGIGVVLRQGTNFEFATLPERLWLLLGLAPFLPGWVRRRRLSQRVLSRSSPVRCPHLR